MTALKRNIWTLFWLVYGGGLVLLIVLVSSSWHATVEQYERHHETRVEFFAQSVASILGTQELVLDVIGRELLRRSEFPVEPLALPLLDSAMESSPSLAGLGLARPNGQLIALSSNIILDQLPNLMESEYTRPSFQLALTEDKMVLGRTYFFEPLGEWIIPVRKALRNDAGDVLAVMTAGIRIEGKKGIFSSDRPDDESLMLFRERDGYLQFLSREDVGPEVYSTIRRPDEQIRSDTERLERESGKSIEAIKRDGNTVIYYSERDSGSYLGAAVYDSRFELWVISESGMAAVLREFFKQLAIFVGLFLLVSGLLYYLFSLIDRVEKKRRDELFHQSRHDDLTGLMNRVGLIDEIHARIDARTPFCIVLVDIDNFRGINDRFGQDFGDRVLADWSRCLWQAAGEEAVVASLGGDEFAVVTGISDEQQVYEYCQSLLSETGQRVLNGALGMQIGASIGAAIFPANGDSFSSIVRSAHLALHKAKKNRNDVCLFQSDIETRYLRRVHIEQRLRGALEPHLITMAYQAQVDAEGRVVGMEALARWYDDELGYVPPDEFVSVAEASGLMVQLGNYVLDRSLEDFSGLPRHKAFPLELSVNISVLQFMQPGFAETVLEKLHHHHVAPNELTLEITETMFMSRQSKILPVLNQLRESGIRLSMDDFGTGYSSLSLLRSLPIDELKVDKIFVDNINEDKQARKMVESIIAIARNHEMELVAEGVEHKEQADTLIAIGCQRFQGFYFSRPVPIDEVRELLTAAVE
ncbi:putative bifunctional diguanylate cyclase/phosphodiesterase [Marinobacter sp. F4206]|uniref:putative bifunctional diguanylate cyclase/phosphodiesterase n=1 Tax=Marinobacter sp. F4206 TaxID=2861777 RepID=UPI001C5D74A3|nr:EAL domain-containing protein [Marinobacter sp. F4206]MBW4935851.1 EAL domain-containing protein [Marinobacter sp. F4206]